MRGFDPEESEVALPPVEATQSLSDRVYTALKQYISERRLKPGARLSVPHLAGQLHVSRTPVKEALERLVKDGLVTTLPKRGAFVAIIRRDDVDEIYQMREMLEGLAAALAAPQVDTALLVRLQELTREGETAVTHGDISTHVAIDLEFHRLIRERAGNRRLILALGNLQDQVRIVFRTSATIPGRMQRALEEHRRILAALESRDSGQAEAAARNHIRMIREAVMTHIESVETRSTPGFDAANPPGVG